VTNQSASATSGGTLTSTIYDAASNAVASVTSAISLAAGQGLVATQSVSFAANLWSPQSPYRYKLVTTISNQNAVADIYHTPFGVRTVSIDKNNGIFINGQPVEIKGMCNHQDMAGVGVALPDRLQNFRLERLLQMGVNAYRTSHNQPTEELLDACDQLGMLVLDENRRIGTNAEPMSELNRLIRRDRNHPSIFMWSLGNEESLQGDTANGAPVVQAMQNAVHPMDPTRLCTIAMNGGWGSGFSTVIDVQGFNYHMENMDSFHASFPNQPSLGTEISSAVGDRDVYATDWGMLTWTVTTIRPAASQRGSGGRFTTRVRGRPAGFPGPGSTTVASRIRSRGPASARISARWTRADSPRTTFIITRRTGRSSRCCTFCRIGIGPERKASRSRFGPMAIASLRNYS